MPGTPLLLWLQDGVYFRSFPLHLIRIEWRGARTIPITRTVTDERLALSTFWDILPWVFQLARPSNTQRHRFTDTLSGICRDFIVSALCKPPISHPHVSSQPYVLLNSFGDVRTGADPRNLSTFGIIALILHKLKITFNTRCRSKFGSFVPLKVKHAFSSPTTKRRSIYICPADHEHFPFFRNRRARRAPSFLPFTC